MKRALCSALLLVPLGLATAGCKGGDEGPSGCRSTPVAVARGPLSQARGARLLAAGTGFVLADHDGGKVRWARLDSQGGLPFEGTMMLQQASTGVEPALAAMAGPETGERMVAAYAGSTAAGRAAMLAVSQAPGEAPVLTTLWEMSPTATPSGAAAIRVAAGGARATRRVVVAGGVEGTDGSPTVAFVGPGGAVIGQPEPLFRAGATAPWRCLEVVPGRTDLAVSVLDQSRRGRPQWHAFEFREDGSRGSELSVELDVKSASCPAVAPSPVGYVLAYQNDDGVSFSEFDVEKGVVISSLVVGALRFGGKLTQPRVAGVTAVGGEFALLLDRSAGHEVRRFDAFGALRGGPMPLTTANGNVGPASAWPSRDALHVSYLDVIPGNSTQDQRYLTRIDCPAALPVPEGLDGGRLDGK